MDKSLSIIQNVVADMGGTIEEFVPERGCFYINVFGKRILLERNIAITRQSFISVRLTKCKEITYKLLRANSLPSPKTVCFYNKSFNKDQAIEKLNKLTYPIMVKNAVGSNSLGIFPAVSNTKDALKIIKKELPHYRSIIAQEMVFGKEYRVLLVRNAVVVLYGSDIPGSNILV